MESKSKELFDSLLAIVNLLQSVGFIARPQDICPCCRRSKEGLFLEMRHFPEKGIYQTYLWTPWGGITVGAICEDVGQYIVDSLVTGTSPDDYTDLQGMKLYPICRSNLPSPALFVSDAAEKDEEDIRKKAEEWGKLFGERELSTMP